MFESGRILLVCDDEEASRRLREILMGEGGLFITSVTSFEAGLSAFRQENFDLVVSRFVNSGLASIDFIKGLRKLDADCLIIGFVEGLVMEELKTFSDAGVFDFISRPFSGDKLIPLVKKGMQVHSLLSTDHKLMQGLREQNTSLEKQNIFLAKRIEEATKNLTRLYEDLRSTYMRTIKVLAQAIEARDHYTHSHSENVAKYAVAIAEEFNLSAKDIETIREACELHDLGKIGIEDCILSKASNLNEQEWEQIKKHPNIGAQILEPLTFLSEVTELVRQHHERFDGSGYPEGRRGNDILLGARIIHLADAYESMRSSRSYRKIPFTKEQALAEINKNSGTQFDPKVVGIFLKIVDKL